MPLMCPNRSEQSLPRAAPSFEVIDDLILPRRPWKGAVHPNTRARCGTCRTTSKRKARKTEVRDWVSARQRFEPNLEFPPLRIPAMC
jgi:hypothetical protein